MSGHSVIITRASDAPGFVVDVVPAIDGEVWRTAFPTFKGARGFAGGIRLSRGYPIDDRTGGGA